MKRITAWHDPVGLCRMAACLLALMLCPFVRLSAQERVTVSGNVKDPSGQPIAGVSVIARSGTGGTTAANGSFSLLQVPIGDTLTFSIIGYQSREVAVTGSQLLNIVLENQATDLNELVLVGYGTAKKKDLTGAVSTINGQAIANRQTTQISSALQGAVAGVMVTRSSSAPGAGATIRIRGISSIQESDPLIIVDGVPVSDLNTVNPADVESVTVLKDAASASIYGSRAAAGVVLITTKRGTSGVPSFDYSFTYAIDKPTRMPGYADAVTYMKMQNELAWNAINNDPASEYPVHDRNLIDNYASLHAQNPDQYPDTRWLDYILNKSAARKAHVLSIATGDAKKKTKATIGYDEVDGLFRYNLDYKRFTARINNDIKINKFLTAIVDVNFRRTASVNPVYSPSATMRYAAPIYAAEWSDGRVAEGKGGTNPYGLLKEGGNIKRTENQLGGRLMLEVAPLRGLKISGVFSPNFNFNKSKSFATAVPYTPWNDPNVRAGYLEGAATTKLTEARAENYQLTTQFFANYNKELGAHSLNGMVGYENYYSFYETMATSRDQYDLIYYPYLDAGPRGFLDNEGDAYEYAYRSYFGRLMYNYDQKYYFQANLRYDGSSRFHKDHRWGAFPSFSAGWVLSRERFMEKVDFISYLKLRGSWGQLGNERIGNYPYQATLEFNNPVLYQGGTATGVQGASAYQYVIPDISWETTESFNLALDVNFLNDRLSFTGEWYKKTTRDMLLALQIPAYLGFSNPQQNAGTMYTRGWEMQVGWRDKAGKLNYSVSVNLSDFRSRMGDLKGTEFLGAQVKFAGSEFNEWYGYRALGIYQNIDDVLNSPVTANTVTIGDIRYLDISGPDGKPDGKISPEYDRVLLGGSLPRYLYGGNINLEYKGFDFGLVFQGVGKQNVMLTEQMVRPLRAQWYNIPDFLPGNYYSIYNTAEQNAAARYPRLSDISGANNYAVSDFWMFNGAYFRIKNISLGYTLPAGITKRALMQQARFFVNMSDFFTKSKYPRGWDPEISDTGYPITRSIVFGVSVKF